MVIVDASVAARWFVALPLAAQAAEVIQIHDDRRAPRLLVSELGNTLWKYIRLNTISVDDAAFSLARLTPHYVDLSADEDFAPAACRIAAAINHPFYDCLYLAMARVLGCPLVTADARLLARAPLVPDIVLLDLSSIPLSPSSVP